MRIKPFLRNAFIITLTGVIIMTGFSGCFGAKHKVDYDGNFFQNGKEEYRAGSTVKLEYYSTDGRYCSFFVDGEETQAEYTKEKMYVIKFKMPDHDVKISVEKSDFGKEAILQFHSFDGGGADYSAVIEDPSVVTYEYEKNYGKKNHEHISGAGYDVYFTFTGVKPGTTTLTIESRSPIAQNYDIIYDVTVNDELDISVKQREKIDIRY